MKASKKFWSLLLALVMVVSLMSGAFVVGAADEAITITPTATYGGETVTMTATGVGSQYTVFDLASIGFGTGIEYALWFSPEGSFSFDKAVTMYYQGAPVETLEAGKVYAISGGEGSWSERYITLDDGNMLAIVDSSAPGNFASLAADTELSAFPGTVVSGTAPAAEAPAEEAPAAEGTAFAAATELEVGKSYLLVVEDGGKYYALGTNGVAFTPVEVAEAGAAEIVTSDDSVIWVTEAGPVFKNAGLAANPYLYPSSSMGLMTYGSGRSFTYTEAGALTTNTSAGEFAITFADGAFGFKAVGGADDAKFFLFAAAEAAAEEPVEETPLPKLDPIVRSAVKNADGSITLAFTSDVHYDGVNMNLQTWLEKAEETYGYIDAMGFCGDMGSAYATSAADFWSWAGEVMDYVDTQIEAGKIGDAVYTTGNHEWFPYAGGDYVNNLTDPAAARIMQVGEALRTEDYIIYDFGAGKIAATFVYDYNEGDIAELDAYLSTAPTDIPIFILTHFPIHLWEVDRESRYVAHANELIDVLNKYENVVVLWGHNHSNYDENYYNICHKGDEIVINPEGEVRTLNFDYLTAGVTADAEYTGPSAGSKWTLNKGLIVTIAADGSLEYDYITLDGKVMEEEGPYLVQFRQGFGDYAAIDEQYVETGAAAVAPEAPAIDDYEFVGWDVDFSNITRPLVVTATYKKIIDMSPITVTPKGTFNGEKITMTATGVDKDITVFDLASIGYGTGIEYGFWFDPNGTFSFDKDVTLTYQGAPAATLTAGTVYSIADGYEGRSWSEMYVQLSDGNMLMILDMTNPGNFASLAADTPVSAFPGKVAQNAIVSPQSVTLDGEEVTVEHYNIAGYNYFKLRDVAAILNGGDKQFNVGYDTATKQIALTTGEAYEFVGGELSVEDHAGEAIISTQKVTLNGEEVALRAYNIGGYNFFKLRDLDEVLGFGVDFDAESNTALITTK